jgi:hypothetical protein
VGSIGDELGSVEAAQTVDRAEPQEPAGVTDDAADTRVRKAVFDRVDANRQTLRVRHRGGDKKQPRGDRKCATRAAPTNERESSRVQGPSIVDQNDGARRPLFRRQSCRSASVG